MDAEHVTLFAPEPTLHSRRLVPRLDAEARAGALVRVRRGVYVAAEDWLPNDQQHGTILAARALQSRAAVPLVFSHRSAAIMLGLPIVGARDDRLHVTNLDTTARRSRHGVVWHSTRWPERVEVQQFCGLTITTPRQTALDLARSASRVTAFIVADALAQRSAMPSEVREWWHEQLAEWGPARGTRRALGPLGAVTGLAESPLESLSLWRMLELGFEMPQQQVEIETRRGLFRLDFGWQSGTIAGEADGRSKYGGRESPECMEQRLWEEKLRHDAVREKLQAYPRWDWDDAWRGHGLERALLEAGVPRLRRPMPVSF